MGNHDCHRRNMLRDIAAEKEGSTGERRRLLPGAGRRVWRTPAVDLETRTVFFVVGNPSPDLYGAIRPGDNL